MSRGDSLRRALVGATTAFLLPVGLLAVTTTSAAALDVPSLVGPTGSVSGSPTLEWAPVAGADSYSVQVTGAGGYSWSVASTTNTHAVPETVLPSGTITWNVQAKSGSTTSDSATGTFSHDLLTGPDLTGPADDSQSQQPVHPLTFTWGAVQGVDHYEIQLATDSEFTPARLVSGVPQPKGTAWSPSFILPAGRYWWHVRGIAANNVATDWSRTGTLVAKGLAVPQQVAPANDPNVEVQDVVLDWNPVPGAATYNLQVSTDQNFTTTVEKKTGLMATRYSPPTTYENDQYYWRVQAVDASGNVSVDADGNPSWSPAWVFKRAWSDQPVLLHPQSLALKQAPEVVGDPLYLQWSPVHLASRYQVQIRTDNTWPANGSGTTTCDTPTTTMVLPMTVGRSLRRCGVVNPGTYYWRVLGYDDPSAGSDNTPVTVSTAGSPIQTGWFDYEPALATPLSPADGSDVTVPTLSWSSVGGAARYKVTITKANDGTAVVATTSATSYTPRDALPVDYQKDAKGEYVLDANNKRIPLPTAFRWNVQTIDTAGTEGAYLLTGAQPTFTLVPSSGTASAATPTSPPDIHGLRFPTLTWTPVRGADTYWLSIRPVGTSVWTPIGQPTTYPAWQDASDDNLGSGTYEWFVEAWNGGNYLSSGPVGTYTIDSFVDPRLPDDGDPTTVPGVSGHAAGLTGNAITGAEGTTVDTCDAGLPANCQNLVSTPVLSWDAPSPDVSSYLLYISSDAEMTHILPHFNGLPVGTTMWSTYELLADSDAGSAYYWNVVPVRDTVADQLHNAAQAFNKLSKAPLPLTPAMNSIQKDDVTLTWRDLLLSPAGSAVTPLTTDSQVEAQQYQVEAWTTDGGTIAKATVDQPTWTLTTTTYPEGPINWHVAAIDGDAHLGPWSSTMTFTKRSPVPDVGASGTYDNGTLTWPWLDFAARYNLEVYKNDDTTATSANKVSLTSSSSIVQSAYSFASPLPAGRYAWRVQRVDKGGKLGAWSATATPNDAAGTWGHFTVSGTAVTLRAPGDGADVHPAYSVFTWDPVPGAAKYTYARYPHGSTSATETATTVATSYAPKKAFASGTWDWKVTAYDAAGAVLGTSVVQTVVVNDTPKALTDVSVTGDAHVGGTLVSSPPTWDMGAEVTTTYQWYRGTTAIPGATGTSYIVTGDDYNKAVKVVATGARPGYKSGTSTSNAFTIAAAGAPTATQVPSIGGDAHVDGTLRVQTEASWSPVSDTTYTWYRDSTSTGKTGLSYTVVGADALHTLTVRATSTLPGYAAGTVTSNGVTALAGVAATAVADPVVVGATVVGSTLSLQSAMQWTRNGNPVTASCTKYQWLRNGLPITSSGTSSTYKTVPADAGLPISVRVTCAQTGYDTSSPALSNSIVPEIGAAPVATAPPTLSGTPKLGARLSARTGTWSRAGKYTYQWLRDNAPIAGATGSSYAVTLADVPHALSVRVTNTPVGFLPASATSAAVRVPKVVSTAKLSLKSSRLKPKKYATMTVTISASGVTGPTGTVQILAKGKVVAKKALASSQRGKLTIKVKFKKKGKYPIVVRYLGSTTVAASQSAKATLTVKK